MVNLSNQVNLRVFITHFVPPEPSPFSFLRDFVKPRLSTAYLRSWARLIRYGTRGHQPWKKDVMTDIRRRDQKNRLRYLCNQILILNQMNLRSLEIYIHTNSIVTANHLNGIFNKGNLKILTYPRYNYMNQLHNSPWVMNDPKSPWHLTWEHKATLAEVFRRSDQNTLFLCLEDDTLFTSGNLDYFLRNKNSLQSLGLLPSFLQVEFSNELGQFFAVGNFTDKKIMISELPMTKVDNQVFVQMPNPYSGIIVLDYLQANEYINSAAFSEEKSRELTWWDVGARAAMGLQFVNPPSGFTSRNVLPLNEEETGIGLEAWVIHQPNIYVEKREIVPGLAPDSLFATR